MMTGIDPHQPYRSACACCPIRRVVLPATMLLLAFALSGCQQSRTRSPWSDQSLLQVQFFAPTGATVCVQQRRGDLQTKQIPGYGNEHRLESPPTQFAAFNLKPNSSYDFMYQHVDGFPNGHVYGEMDIFQPKSEDAVRYMAHAFVPVDLLNRHSDARGENYHPAKGASGTGLGALESEHLAEGDVIEHVYFIADLQKAWETIRQIDYHVEKLRSAEAVLNSELELLDNRYRSYRRDSLYADPTTDSLARSKDASGANEQYIRIEADRQRLDNQRFLIRRQVDDLTQERRIRTRLLDTMRIVSRRGSLVMATPENQWPYHDTKEQITGSRSYEGHVTGPTEAYTTGDIVIPSLGELVCVVRIGGRHMHWDTPDAEQLVMTQ